MTSRRFSLESVLELRRLEEDEARTTCASANAALRRAEDTRHAARRRVEEERVAFRKRAARIMSAGRFTTCRTLLAAAESAFRTATRALDRARTRLTERTAELLEARRERKVLSTLEERTWRRHLKQSTATEQRSVEDVIAARVTAPDSTSGTLMCRAGRFSRRRAGASVT